MIPWFRSVVNNVIDAGVELANEFDSLDDSNNTNNTNNTNNHRERSYSSPLNLKSNSSQELERTNSLKFSNKAEVIKEKRNIFEGATPLELGVTPLLKEYVSNLCNHADTWIEFPVEEVLKSKNIEYNENEMYFLSDKEEAHAVCALNEIPQLNELRYYLVPKELSDERFWRIYFLLISNKFQLSDSDENFRMEKLQKSDNSLKYNLFYTNYGSNTSQSSDISNSWVTFLRKSSETMSIWHPPSLLTDKPVHWWSTNKTGSRNSYYNSTFIHDSQGKQGQSTKWEKVNLELLKQDRPKIFKLLVRCGIPDDYRHKVWILSPSQSLCINNTQNSSLSTISPRYLFSKKLNKLDENKKEENDYKTILQNIFGNEVPISCNPIPTFGGDISFNKYHYISNGGILSIRRILIVLALTKKQLHFAPILTNLVSLLISFMAEDDTYYLSSILIDESISRCHYIPLGNRQLVLFGKAFIKVLSIHLPLLKTYIDNNNIDISSIFIKWCTSLFVNYIPYQTVLRILDCLFYEGSTILYRVSLALLSHCITDLLNCNNTDEFNNILHNNTLKEYNADILLTDAWKFKVKHEHLVIIYNDIVNSGELDDITEHEMDIIRLPTVNINANSILTLENFEILWTWIPERYRIYDPVCLFNSEIDGFNLKTLVNNCKEYIPTILVIKTSTKKIFGVFVNQQWKYNDDYYGNGETFLFTLYPLIEKYSWIEDSNHCFMHLPHGGKQVTFGGGNKGDGLRLDEELDQGQSYSCASFNNKPLHGNNNDPEFKCTIVEVYGIFET